MLLFLHFAAVVLLLLLLLLLLIPWCVFCCFTCTAVLLLLLLLLLLLRRCAVGRMENPSKAASRRQRWQRRSQLPLPFGIDVLSAGANVARAPAQETGDAVQAGQGRRGGLVRPDVHEAAPGADSFRSTW